MVYRKRNGFLSFCFAFMPGAVEMYMGFMIKGLSLMASFVMLGAIACTTNFLSDSMLFVLLGYLWVYSFFHAWYMYGLSADKLVQMEDKCFWTEFEIGQKAVPEMEKLRKVFAPWALAVCALVIYSCVVDIAYTTDLLKLEDSYFAVMSMPRAVLPIIFVIAGIKLLRRDEKDD